MPQLVQEAVARGVLRVDAALEVGEDLVCGRAQRLLLGGEDEDGDGDRRRARRSAGRGRRRSPAGRSCRAARGPAAAGRGSRGRAGTGSAGRPAASAAARSRSAGSDTSAGRRPRGRAARPRGGARRRPCRPARGPAGRRRSARSGTPAGTGWSGAGCRGGEVGDPRCLSRTRCEQPLRRGPEAEPDRRPQRQVDAQRRQPEAVEDVGREAGGRLVDGRQQQLRQRRSPRCSRRPRGAPRSSRRGGGAAGAGSARRRRPRAAR